MSVFDKAKDKAEQFMGDAKEKMGQQQDDQQQDGGERDQMSGEGQEQGNGLRDKAQDAFEGAKERFGQ